MSFYDTDRAKKKVYSTKEYKIGSAGVLIMFLGIVAIRLFEFDVNENPSFAYILILIGLASLFLLIKAWTRYYDR